MQKTIAALFGLFAVLSAVAVPSDGNLTLTRIEGFYVIPAGLDFNPTSGQVSATTSLVVSLYSNKFFVGTNCSGFDIDIAGHGFSVGNTSGNAVFLNNKFTGNLTTANITIDSNNWILKNNIYYNANCLPLATTDTDFSPAQAAGIVGLGFNDTSLNNYPGTVVPSLSVSLTEDLSTGTLLFVPDSDRTDKLNSASKLTTTNSWQLSTVGKVTIGDTSVVPTDNTTRVIFDLNTDSVALPASIYQSVIQGFKDSNCTLDSIAFPTCTINGSLDQLPTITITSGGSNLTISPQAYVLYPSQYNATAGGTVTLALRSLNTTAATAATGHVTTTFNNAIVLGAPIFSYYYVVFSGTRDTTNTAGTVEFFQADPIPGPGPGPAPPGPTSKWWIVLVILAVVLIGVGIYWFVARRNKANRLQEEINGNLLRA